MYAMIIGALLAMFSRGALPVHDGGSWACGQMAIGEVSAAYRGSDAMLQVMVSFDGIAEDAIGPVLSFEVVTFGNVQASVFSYLASPDPVCVTVHTGNVAHEGRDTGAYSVAR